MKQKFYIFLLLSFTALACKAQVKLTISNVSKEDFKSLRVNIRGNVYEFKNFIAGTKVKLKVKEVHRYFYAKVITSTDTLILQPTDFVGETLFTKGKLDVKFDILTNKNERNLHLNARFLSAKKTS